MYRNAFKKQKRYMDRMEYTSIEQIPLFLDADCLALVLGISRAKAYQLMHDDTFPALRILKDHFGRRKILEIKAMDIEI